MLSDESSRRCLRYLHIATRHPPQLQSFPSLSPSPRRTSALVRSRCPPISSLSINSGLLRQQGLSSNSYGRCRILNHGHHHRTATPLQTRHLSVAATASECTGTELLLEPPTRIDTTRLGDTPKSDKYMEIAHVYDTCASLLLVPHTTTRLLQLPLLQDGSLPSTSKPTKNSKQGDMWVYETVIELPEWGIRASAEDKLYPKAFLLAAAKLNSAMVDYYKIRSLVLPTDPGLNHENFTDFLAFYKYRHPRAALKLSGKENMALAMPGSKDNCVYQWQVTLDGIGIGVPINSSKLMKLWKFTSLSAAVHLARQDNTLLHDFFEELKKPKPCFRRPTPGGFPSPNVIPTSPASRSPASPSPALPNPVSLEPRPAKAYVNVPPGILNIMSSVSDEILQPRDEILTNIHHQRKDNIYEHEHFYRKNVDISPEAINRRTIQLKQRLKTSQSDKSSEQLRKAKNSLPVNQHHEQIVNMVSGSTYSIITASTGSGKTTQVPQILLEDAILKGEGGSTNIICSQPRRIAAMSVARRVAAERREELEDTVGYHVRFDAKTPKNTGSITFCTTGILLKQLHYHADELMDKASHIVLDEVHERNLDIDFLMLVLKNVVDRRKRSGLTVPKVVLMSATFDAELFATYFGHIEANGVSQPCPSIVIPGRNFPVQEFYLDDIFQQLDHYDSAELDLLKYDPTLRKYCEYEDSLASRLSLNKSPHNDRIEGQESTDMVGETESDPNSEEALIPFSLVATTVAHIARTSSQGAILVFLPGMQEILKVEELLRMQPLGVDFGDTSRFRIFALHSLLKDTQTDVFAPLQSGCRKIILATNIAETSITIADIQYVVDSGKLRETHYDSSTQISSLPCMWVSKSSVKQRAGRAGRTQNGSYYGLYSRARFESFQILPLPEIMRSNLQRVCLDVRQQSLSTPIKEYLAQAIEPPEPDAIEAAVQQLQSLDALTQNEEITTLGRLLSSLSVAPAFGKLVVLGVVFRCFDSMLILAAKTEAPDLFVRPAVGERESARAAKLKFSAGTRSDQIAVINAFRTARAKQKTSSQSEFDSFIAENYIRRESFWAISQNMDGIERQLSQMGVIPFRTFRGSRHFECGHVSLNQNSNNLALIKALMMASYPGNIAIEKSLNLLRTGHEQPSYIENISINGRLNLKTEEKKNARQDKGYRSKLFAFSSLHKSHSTTFHHLRETTQITSFEAALFSRDVKFRKPVWLVADNWLHLHVASAGPVFQKFRKAMDQVFSEAFSKLLKGERERFLAEDPRRDRFSEALIEVLESTQQAVIDEKEGREDYIEGEKDQGVEGEQADEEMGHPLLQDMSFNIEADLMNYDQITRFRPMRYSAAPHSRQQAQQRTTPARQNQWPQENSLPHRIQKQFDSDLHQDDDAPQEAVPKIRHQFDSPRYNLGPKTTALIERDRRLQKTNLFRKVLRQSDPDLPLDKDSSQEKPLVRKVNEGGDQTQQEAQEETPSAPITRDESTPALSRGGKRKKRSNGTAHGQQEAPVVGGSASNEANLSQLEPVVGEDRLQDKAVGWGEQLRSFWALTTKGGVKSVLDSIAWRREPSTQQETMGGLDLSLLEKKPPKMDRKRRAARKQERKETRAERRLTRQLLRAREDSTGPEVSRPTTLSFEAQVGEMKAVFLGWQTRKQAEVRELQWGAAPRNLEIPAQKDLGEQKQGPAVLEFVSKVSVEEDEREGEPVVRKDDDAQKELEVPSVTGDEGSKGNKPSSLVQKTKTEVKIPYYQSLEHIASLERRKTAMELMLALKQRKAVLEAGDGLLGETSPFPLRKFMTEDARRDTLAFWEARRDLQEVPLNERDAPLQQPSSEGDENSQETVTRGCVRKSRIKARRQRRARERAGLGFASLKRNED
ncbi:hypothetical protein G7Y89_g14173 [Cudoniella acicularis]|uniref:RNA helicase n=1 Tax=Cudoniella acicularis TaxID=354080 RepID=A0A8H4R643_9HELO|nr:hypothetical protein G7Y89_g14173 [Cudoniella acicularis]